MSDDDFKTAALEQSKTIDILDFFNQDDLDPRDFTTFTVPERLRKIGDVWSPAMKRKNSLKPLLER